MDSIRQQQTASLVQQALSEVFVRQGRDYYGSYFVTISYVRMTPDLLTARVYLSVYNAPNKQGVVDMIGESTPAIRHAVGSLIRNKVRRVPELEFYVNDTLDEMEKVEDMFKRLNEEEPPTA